MRARCSMVFHRRDGDWPIAWNHRDIRDFSADGDTFNWTSVVCMLTLPLADLGHHELAASLIGWVEQRQNFGLSVTTVTAKDLKRVADDVQAQLGSAMFDELSQGGTTLSDEELMSKIRPTLADILGRAPAPTR